MEPRKIQRVGSSTLAVSLPSDWVKAIGLKKGDFIYFDREDEGTLKLLTSAEHEREKSAESVEVNADLCKTPQMLSKILVGNYILGRDIVRVVSKTRLDSNYVNEIRKTIRELMGLAIIEETGNKIILQSSIDITKFPIHTVVRRLFIIASTMYKEAIDALLKSEASLAKDTIQRRVEADSMFWVIVRLIDSAQRDKVTANQIHIQNTMQILWYRIVAQCLWLIAKWSDKIAKKVIELERNRHVIGDLLLEEVLNISEKAYGICHKAMNSLFSSDIESATKTIADYNRIQQIEEQLQESICTHAYLKEKDFSVTKYFKGKKSLEPCMIAQLSFIVWSIRRIAELGSEIAEIAITKALGKQTKLAR